MNAHIQAIKTALTPDGDTQLHHELVIKSQKLRQMLDKITTCVTDREAQYSKVRELHSEMKNAMDAMVSDEACNQELRPVTKIAADLKKANDAIDKEIDKVYDLISAANGLRTEVAELTKQLCDIPLVATAA